MKTLKSILTVLAFTTLLSCSKKHITPYIPTGGVTYTVTNNDTNDVSSKHIIYGYEDVTKDTVVVGNFEITLKVPASNSQNELKRIFIKCTSEDLSNFSIRLSQTLEFAGNMPLFSMTSAGTCKVKERSLSNNFYINAE